MFGAISNLFNKASGQNYIDTGLEKQIWYGQKANEELKQLHEQSQNELQPWKASGLRALSGMENDDFQRDFKMSDFQKDPGYDFRMAEGAKALERSAAARGGVQNGATLKALSRYNQDFAANEFNNAYSRFNADRDRRFGRLSSIAGIGQNALNTGINTRNQYGKQMSSNMTGMGNANSAAGGAKMGAHQQLLGSLFKLGGTIAGGA